MQVHVLQCVTFSWTAELRASDILNLSKIKAGKVGRENEEMDLNTLINDSVTMVASLADEK